MFGYLKTKRNLHVIIGPKKLITFFLFVIMCIALWANYHSGLFSLEFIRQYSFEHPIKAILLFLLLYSLTVLFALPSLPLNLAGGYFFGGLIGGIYSCIAVTIGSWLSFAYARWLVGQPLSKKLNNNWAKQIQLEFNKHGWKFVAFARINPVIPTGPLNYLLGLTSLSNSAFLLTTFLFLLPPTIAVSYVGDSLQTFTASNSSVAEVLRGIYIVSAVLTSFVFVKFLFNYHNKQKQK